MTTFEQEQLRQLKRMNAQLNPGPALLKVFALIFAALTALAACACWMNSQRSDVQAAALAARHKLRYNRPLPSLETKQSIKERNTLQ